MIKKLISTENELIEFERKTGVIIDEYGKTNLHLDHIKLLKKLIVKANEWKTIFEKAIDLNINLIIEGD